MPKGAAVVDYQKCHPERCNRGVCGAVLECEYGSLVPERPTKRLRSIRLNGATAAPSVLRLVP